MKSSQVLVYEPKHLEVLDLKDDGHFSSLLVGGAKARLEVLGELGNGCIIVHDGIALAVMGFCELWRGVYEFWTMPSVHVDKYPKVYASTIKKYVENVMGDLPGHRFQIVAVADAKHDRWLKFLKFEHESVLRKFSDTGQDFNMWVRIP